MHITLTEFIGYIATLVLILSFIMKDIRKLRLVTCFGASLWVIYGVMVPSIPLAVANFMIISINIYYLIRTQ
jgi:hypothetical protein